MAIAKTSHVYTAIYLHLNWQCKHSAPMLSGPIESQAHAFIENYCRKTKGLRYLAIGGTDTHIHLAIQMQGFVCLADWIGKAKGTSAHEMNRRFGRDSLVWQRGYGAVSFAEKNLPAIRQYIERQKEHHGSNSLNDVLENCGQERSDIDQAG